MISGIVWARWVSYEFPFSKCALLVFLMRIGCLVTLVRALWYVLLLLLILVIGYNIWLMWWVEIGVINKWCLVIRVVVYWATVTCWLWFLWVIFAPIEGEISDITHLPDTPILCGSVAGALLSLFSPLLVILSDTFGLCSCGLLIFYKGSYMKGKWIFCSRLVHLLLDGCVIFTLTIILIWVIAVLAMLD